MSWNFLDGLSRRQHHSCWTVPENLGETSQHGTASFRRSVVPNPDVLLEYVDKAISAAEYAQATMQLSLPNGPSPSSPISAVPFLLSPSPLPTPFSSNAAKYSGDDLARTASPVARRKMSRFKSISPLPQKYIDSLLKHKRHQEDATSSESFHNMLAEEHASLEGDSYSSVAKEGFPETEGASREIGEGGIYDARAADDAYRAAYCALSEGKAELALSLLCVALSKCPPDKTNALGRVHKLMRAASQRTGKDFMSTEKDDA